MILSILATVAVLAAIAVIAAALVFAEALLVYIALGLAGASVLLLLGAIIQGRSEGERPDRSGTDGLGKSSVPVKAPTPTAAVPAAHVDTEHSGRMPAPVPEPVREAPIPERPLWPTPATDDSGHGEPEYDVPRWETPTAGDRPEPVASTPAPSEDAPRWQTPVEGGWPLPEPASEDWSADTAEQAEWAQENGAAVSDEHALDADPFSYGVPGRSSYAEEEPADGDEGFSGEPSVEGFAGRSVSETVADEEPEEVEPFSYSVPRWEGSAPGDTAAVETAEEYVFGEDFAEDFGGDAGPGTVAASEETGTADGDTEGTGDTGDTEGENAPETTVFEAPDEDPEPVAGYTTGSAEEASNPVDLVDPVDPGSPGEAEELEGSGGTEGIEGIEVPAESGTEDTAAEPADSEEEAGAFAPFSYRVPDRDGPREGAEPPTEDEDGSDEDTAPSYRTPRGEDGVHGAECEDRDGDTDGDEGSEAVADGDEDSEVTAVFTREDQERVGSDGEGGEDGPVPDYVAVLDDEDGEDGEDGPAPDYAAVLDGDADTGAEEQDTGAEGQDTGRVH